jgi:predicted acylesterase/phospholipase RssA
VGAVYEIGALRALEEAVDGLDFNDLSVYVGVSAGSLVASLLANGVNPAQMVRALVEQDADDDLLSPRTFFTPAYREWLSRGAGAPLRLANAMWQFASQPFDPSLFKLLSRVVRSLPVALYDNEPIREHLERAFSYGGRTDDFRKLRRKLVVVSTDLGAGEPIRFGDPEWAHVPISTAVQASTALPGLYPPVDVDGRHCVDGVLLKTVHASVALDAGATLVICINPIVPIDTSAGIRTGAFSKDVLLAGGLPSLISQTFRTLIYSRLDVGLAAYEQRYKDSDYVLFEPNRDEYEMFFSNIFSFKSRRAVCELAYRATRRDLAARYDTIEPLLRRHGFRIKRDVLRDERRSIWSGVGLPPRKRPRRGDSVVRELDRALSRLEPLV